jgi:peroxiredoxin
VQLTQWTERYSEIGVGVAAMTYDAQEVLQKFHSEQNLNYPLLQDVEVEHVEKYGIRNEDYGPDSRGYGVPHPGILFLDAQGVVVAKFAIAGYRTRPPFDELYERIAGKL